MYSYHLAVVAFLAAAAVSPSSTAKAELVPVPTDGTVDTTTPEEEAAPVSPISPLNPEDTPPEGDMEPEDVQDTKVESTPSEPEPYHNPTTEYYKDPYNTNVDSSLGWYNPDTLGLTPVCMHCFVSF